MTAAEFARADAAALEGSLREMPLGDVLQLLDLGRKSGILRVEDPRDARAVTMLLVDGRIAAAEAHSLSESVTPSPPSGASATHRRHVVDVVCDVLAWSAGRFAVAPLAMSVTPGARRAAVAVDAVLLEGAHRADEWTRLSDIVSGPDAVPTLLVLPAGDALSLTPDEWRVIALADGMLDVRALATRLERDVLGVARDVHRLVSIGALAVAHAAGRSSAH